ncbi:MULTISPECIES: SemiSWEET transporter [Prochlorococcus]|uniref:Uncharacterized conserved membrane protein n=1 Tax=Prochlorococcus marinus (strain SARG / CCMP1375 / SS120) TaxID=167539 RepID=Q7VBA4_PROMA|nr:MULTISPECIES: SemiSWEET transporter [Prochlorococcus]AAQ00238.1 Uncharacterized conserved membrane protein [Prochlorococcus marinus subsp. marinus str. CCMP1375]KGG14039.1 hypothetical protein EV04_0524 [Prochlorococcus marinus str. LG]KGG19171.1 hypothetical protein EV08_1658 [Prochlorococcus marinus str. SS2]KGG23288.1 hypothetical protein EV09_0912 [Prochlorococcus marinus str. SS35]KGG32477.1 hypothetical protein EV10_1592 [Prochlorococcus marinus str. SS51]
MTDFYGFFAAFLTTIAFLPQVIKTFRTKSAEDVSVLMLVLFITGLIFWIIYGLGSNALPVVVANVITLIFNVSILTLKLAYGKNKIKTEWR